MQEEIIAQLERGGWPEHAIFSVRLALEEALANAVKHGNRLDPSKHIRVFCKIDDSDLHMEVADEGPGFDPAAVPDPLSPERLEEPSGRGIMLMRSFMDRVEYIPPGNCVALDKHMPLEAQC